MPSGEIAVKTNPKLWEKCVNEAKTKFDDKYSARMYQYALHLYKSRGGKFSGKKSERNSMRVWTAEEWGTKSGTTSVRGDHPSGERYLPKYVRERLSKREYAISSRKKRADSKRGRQYSREPGAVSKKISNLMKKSKRRASKLKSRKK